MRVLVTAVVLVCTGACGPSIESEVPGPTEAPARRRSTRPVCPGQPLFAIDRVYCVLPEPRTFSAAATACRAAGMELASIHSSEQNEALRSVVAPPGVAGPYTSMWFGLSDIEQEGAWRWSSGARLESTAWAPQEPNDAGANEDCGQLYIERNTWNDFPCAAALPYVCQRPTAEGRFRCTGTALTTLRMNYCVHTDLRPWADARTACADDGSTLAEFVSFEERTAFAKLVAVQSLPKNVWLGATDTGKEGRFEWLDGTPVQFSAFAPGEPNNAGGAENCVEWIGPDGKWNDLPCEQTRATLCEVRSRR